MKFVLGSSKVDGKLIKAPNRLRCLSFFTILRLVAGQQSPAHATRRFDFLKESNQSSLGAAHQRLDRLSRIPTAGFDDLISAVSGHRDQVQ